MYEYGPLKPVGAILRGERGKRKNNGEDEPNRGTLHAYGNVTVRPPLYNHYILIKNILKCKCFSSRQ
jgi:hypothetical protein